MKARIGKHYDTTRIKGDLWLAVFYYPYSKEILTQINQYEVDSDEEYLIKQTKL